MVKLSARATEKRSLKIEQRESKYKANLMRNQGKKEDELRISTIPLNKSKEEVKERKRTLQKMIYRVV